MGGTMKQLFKPESIKSLWILLLTALIVKAIWFVVGVILLPTTTIEHIEKKGGKPLYYRVKLGPNKAPPPATEKRSTIVTGGNIKDIKLLAIYNASDMTIVTVLFGAKTRVLSRGDKVKGFKLQSATNQYAIFIKQGKTYKISLAKTKNSDKIIKTYSPSTPPKVKKSTKADGEIVDAGKLKIIDKSLIEHFSKNINEVNKNIGIREIKDADGKIGFGISFIRRGSPFAKLGIRRGDIIKSINGQNIDSYSAAFGVYKNIANITNLTMVIERNKEEMELEYEVN
ncbi:MAG: PDZ domain-containing protein [Sulfurovum sp.]